MKGPHQGEILLLLAKRSGVPRSEIARSIKINPGHLSRSFKSEKLTSKLRQAAARFFNVDMSVFDVEDISDIPKPNVSFVEEDRARYGDEFADMEIYEIMRYIEEKDKRHYEERGRLLAIIENLTKK